MPKLLVIIGSAEHSLICDMCAIHEYMKTKDVYGVKYLTVAYVTRDKIFHGFGTERKLVFDPYTESKFWLRVDPADFADEAKNALIQLTTVPGTATDRIIVIILTHGDPTGDIQMGNKIIPVSEVLQPLESYPSSRITIISGTCFSAIPTWKIPFVPSGLPLFPNHLPCLDTLPRRP